MLYNEKNIYEDSIKTNDIYRKNYAGAEFGCLFPIH